MELVNTNDENSFDPTPKLKSSPVPILIWFVKKIVFIVEINLLTPVCFQRYCKKCLSSYITEIADIKVYLDVCILTKNLECNEHEINRTKITTKYSRML